MFRSFTYVLSVDWNRYRTVLGVNTRANFSEFTLIEKRYFKIQRWWRQSRQELVRSCRAKVAMEGPAVAGTLPNEGELLLLCLDYLRDLRRAYPPGLLRSAAGINADYLTIACWALNRSFVSPEHLSRDNDAYFDVRKNDIRLDVERIDPERGVFPSLTGMERELMYLENPKKSNDEDQKKEEEFEDSPSGWYEYDDSHVSNGSRFYLHGGLACGPSLKGALSFGEIVAAGLAGLGARSRLDAEKEMIQSPLFDQFLQTVQAKGFFDDPLPPADSSTDENEHKQLVYQDRYRKVVAKFRSKLSLKAETDTPGDLVARSAAEQQRRARVVRVQKALNGCGLDNHSSNGIGRDNVPVGSSTISKSILSDRDSVVSSSDTHNPVDIEEAEKLKSEGNAHMQSKDYREAANCYTQALKLSPAGPNSHVYFSNRAAALVSMKRFQEAILDSERSLALRPDYGKAHARLGLAHFLLGNYRQAMEAYTVALKYEPDNASSKSYLEKAAKRITEVGDASQTNSVASFSVVSEWEKSSQKGSERVQTNDEKEAEKFKVKGNCAMANRDYVGALDAYSKAIQLCPDGSNSHVYFSNRAAALCYLEQYSNAEKDSLKSLSLNPKYGKAHARLGLSRFFLQDYKGAVAAYTSALEYDPDNVASRSYLAKAKAKLDASADARRLFDNPDFRRSAERALNH